jgi:phosphohistidine phosphatase
MSHQKILHIVRHGKSSWDLSNIADIDRPLKLRGIENAYDMARRIKLRYPAPDMLYSSPAIRALHTATIFVRVLQVSFEHLQIVPGIYMGGEKNLNDMVKSLDNSISSVMIFGHNPDSTYFANELSSSYIDNIPTTGIVSISFNTDNWSQIGKATKDNEYFDYPKKSH